MMPDEIYVSTVSILAPHLGEVRGLFFFRQRFALENIVSERTTETTITFSRPFTLTGFDRWQPAGTYRLVIDEEEILGLSFVAYQRKATMLHIPAVTVHDKANEVFQIDPGELAKALEADARANLGL